jgi:hypothetical protein
MADRKEIRTPLGDYTRVSNNYYPTPEGDPWSMNWAGISRGEAGLQAGSYGNPSAPTYFGTAFLPGESRYGQYMPDFNKTLNTPLGSLNVESNYEIPNSISADLTPNARTNYYIQALANLLRGR